MNIQRFITWANEGRRNLRIIVDNINGNGAEPKVWCYDYDIPTGKYVDISGDPPTVEELKVEAMAELREKMARLGVKE